MRLSEKFSESAIIDAESQKTLALYLQTAHKGEMLSPEQVREHNRRFEEVVARIQKEAPRDNPTTKRPR